MTTTTIDLEARRKGVGGTDVAAILGLSPWKTPLDVYNDKLGLADDSPETLPMRMGKFLEPQIAREYVLATGRNITHDGEFVVHPEHPWMLANIDRRCTDGDERGVECKSVGRWTSLDEWGPEGTDEVPIVYLVQCAWYMYVTGRPVWDLAALIGGHELRIYTIAANKRLADRITEAAGCFHHDHVLANNPPDPVTSAEAGLRWARNDGTMKVATREDLANLDALDKVKGSQGKDKDIREKLELALKKSIGTHDGLCDEAGKVEVSWKTQTSKRFDTTRFKEEKPDTYTKFLKSSEFRVLRPKKRK